MADATALTAADRQRLTTLFVLHHDRLVRRLRARLGRYDYHLAEDLAGETWARAVRGFAQFSGSDEQFGRWLATIATRTRIDHYRVRRNSERPTDFSTAPAAYRLPPSPAAEDLAVARLCAFLRAQDTAPAREALGVAA
ncbi:sigma factor [Streptomyces sp. NPDC059063]|uniref:sigma factor n=1 Tax=unclassified Streptomyces TaxID=2593676 RepID=UPI00367F55F8